VRHRVLELVARADGDDLYWAIMCSAIRVAYWRTFSSPGGALSFLNTSSICSSVVAPAGLTVVVARGG